MSKVITFSTRFPSYHPRAGERTYFFEKLHKSIGGRYSKDMPEPEGLHFDAGYFIECEPKHHTIRAGHRFKVGDWFSPRIWSGKAYRSKQIIIAPDIQIKKIWNFEIKYSYYLINRVKLLMPKLEKVARNDGFSNTDDFELWFSNVSLHGNFDGQIICWNENIEY